MNIKEAKVHFDHTCSNLIDKSEGDEIFSRIVEHLTAKSKLELKLDKNITLEDSIFISFITELQTNRPIQYILGYEWFYNLKLFVNESVLIPQPETEELVRWILETIKNEKIVSPQILDIGCGSGCIPVVIKNEMKNTKMMALDISSSALEIAKKNAAVYKLDIHFIEANILDKGLRIEKSFDIIVSNPPYITLSEKSEMHERVLSFEPNEALFVTNADPLQFYRAILNFSHDHLNKDGLIFLELNSEFGIETEILFKNAGYETTLRKDLYENLRMLMARKK